MALFSAAWLLTLPVVVALLAAVRVAHLASIRTPGDGDAVRGPALLVVLAALLHVGLLALTRMAWPAGQPTGLRLLSRRVVLAVWLPLLVAAAYVALLPDDCWRSCSSFPR
jgi:hypothetical protein